MKIKIHRGDDLLEYEAAPGVRLDDVLLSAGVLLDRPCAGRGICGKCRVQGEGRLSPLTEPELKTLSQPELKKGFRLACQARVAGEVRVYLAAAAGWTGKSFSRLEELVESEGPLGLAIDLGTTSVAAFLADKNHGRVFAGHGILNRQAPFGAEVMSRLERAESRPELLKAAAWESMTEATAGLSLSEGVRQRVTAAVVVGNTAMHHLALGLPVNTLVRAPFEPHSRETCSAPAGPLRQLFPALEHVLFPALLGGFVGSDALACVVYFGLGHREEPVLALDLGTNGEVLLSSPGKIWAASTAAGPAFEGVNISCGMRAEAGAITAANRGEAGLELKTVEAMPPAGLAGSGLLAAVRYLREEGLIDESGRIMEREAGEIRVERADGIKRVRLSERVWLTQQDIREVQKAKAAIRAAVEILLERAGVKARELGAVILTGGFGSQVHPEDALALGLLPALPPGIIHAIPNGAGLGGALLLEEERLRAAEALARRVWHVELNLEPTFMERYVSYMNLPAEERDFSSPQARKEEGGCRK